jgi:hypothetical protein
MSNMIRQKVTFGASPRELFHTWSQTSNATDMSTMYPYAHHNTIPAAFIH